MENEVTRRSSDTSHRISRKMEKSKNSNSSIPQLITNQNCGTSHELSTQNSEGRIGSSLYSALMSTPLIINDNKLISLRDAMNNLTAEHPFGGQSVESEIIVKEELEHFPNDETDSFNSNVEIRAFSELEENLQGSLLEEITVKDEPIDQDGSLENSLCMAQTQR